QLCEAHIVWAQEYYRKPTSRRPTRTVNNVRDALRELRATVLIIEGSNFRAKVRVGSIDVRHVTAKLIAQVRDAMASSGRLSRRTCNDRLAVIKRMFAWAADVEQEIVPEEIAARLQLVKPLKYGRSEAAESSPIR